MGCDLLLFFNIISTKYADPQESADPVKSYLLKTRFKGWNWNLYWLCMDFNFDMFHFAKNKNNFYNNSRKKHEEQKNK